MDDKLIKLIIQLAPSILAFIRDHFTSTGQWPTTEELELHVNENLDRYIQIGDDWLSKHPK